MEKTDFSNASCAEIKQNEPFEKSAKMRAKSKEQAENLRKCLRSIILFKHLYDEDLELIINSMFERRCFDGEVVIREGAPGNYFYVILNGVYEVFIRDKANRDGSGMHECVILFIILSIGILVYKYSNIVY